MLAELAAANAAFAIIKQTIQNGRELHTAGKAIADFTHAKDALHVRGNKKRSGFMAKLRGQTADDLEEFMALEQIREKEEQLKQFMIYVGRPGLHGDWVRFQVDARKRRQREAEQAKKDREQLMENLGLGLLALVGVALLTVVGYFVLLAMRERGVI